MTIKIHSLSDINWIPQMDMVGIVKTNNVSIFSNKDIDYDKKHINTCICIGRILVSNKISHNIIDVLNNKLDNIIHNSSSNEKVELFAAATHHLVSSRQLFDSCYYDFNDKILFGDFSLMPETFGRIRAIRAFSKRFVGGDTYIKAAYDLSGHYLGIISRKRMNQPFFDKAKKYLFLQNEKSLDKYAKLAISAGKKWQELI